METTLSREKQEYIHRDLTMLNKTAIYKIRDGKVQLFTSERVNTLIWEALPSNHKAQREPPCFLTSLNHRGIGHRCSWTHS